MKILMSVIASLMLSLSIAGDVAIATHGDDNMVLTNDECEAGGFKFHAHVRGQNFEGCYMISQNNFVVMRRSDNGSIFVYPAVIFDKVTNI